MSHIVGHPRQATDDNGRPLFVFRGGKAEPVMLSPEPEPDAEPAPEVTIEADSAPKKGSKKRATKEG